MILNIDADSTWGCRRVLMAVLAVYLLGDKRSRCGCALKSCSTPDPIANTWRLRRLLARCDRDLCAALRAADSHAADDQPMDRPYDIVPWPTVIDFAAPAHELHPLDRPPLMKMGRLGELLLANDVGRIVDWRPFFASTNWCSTSASKRPRSGNCRQMSIFPTNSPRC